MGIFNTRRRGPVDKYRKKLVTNPTYPFRFINGKLTRSVRYKRFNYAVGGLVLSLIVILIFVGTGQWTHSFFLWPLGMTLVCGWMAYQYREQRHYLLDPETQTYTYRLNNRDVWTGPYHNCYIRLRARSDNRAKNSYFLIFNGYRVEKIYLCKPSEDLEAVRRLGMDLANCLGINYFDLDNVSAYHIIRHTRNQMAD